MGGLYGSLGAEFKKRFNDDYYSGATYHALTMLAEGMAKAKSTDPVKVAFAMEGLKFKSFNGEVEMRKTDHQMQQPLFIAKWVALDPKNTYDVEKTGMTFALAKEFDAYVASTPTSCQMKRPS
jgi:branched-chain amino acid transport system substrate-binding protein